MQKVTREYPRFSFFCFDGQDWLFLMMFGFSKDLVFGFQGRKGDSFGCNKANEGAKQAI
jgi:hypothetical protein